MIGTYIKPDELIFPIELPLKVQIETNELLSGGGFNVSIPLPWGEWCTEMCLQFLFAHGTDLDKIERCLVMARSDQKDRWSRQVHAHNQQFNQE